MKKIIACLGATILSATLAIAFAGCSSVPDLTPPAQNGNGESVSEETESAPVSALATEKKYYDEITEDAGDRPYFLFHADGTGEYYYYEYDSFDNEAMEYTVYFDYAFIDKALETIVCVFDRFEEGERNSDEVTFYTNTTWDRVFAVSEAVIMETDGSLYYNEDFLSDHPNFGA